MVFNTTKILRWSNILGFVLIFYRFLFGSICARETWEDWHFVLFSDTYILNFNFNVISFLNSFLSKFLHTHWNARVRQKNISFKSSLPFYSIKLLKIRHSWKNIKFGFIVVNIFYWARVGFHCVLNGELGCPILFMVLFISFWARLWRKIAGPGQANNYQPPLLHVINV